MTDAPAHDAVDVRQLTRRFGDLTAVDAVAFTVGRGEIFGLLGWRRRRRAPAAHRRGATARECAGALAGARPALALNKASAVRNMPFTLLDDTHTGAPTSGATPRNPP